MLIKQFEEQVKKIPANIAVKTGKKTFSYDRLNRYANRIAAMLGQEWPTAPKNETVGLLLEYGEDMIAAILGVLKAGKVVVPLSPIYPVNRISYILNDCEASLIVTDPGNDGIAREAARENHIKCINIEKTGDYTREKNPHREINGKKTAYLIYTSGSTGKPKGVVQNHENVLYFIRNWVDIFSVTPRDRMTLLSSFCHDASVMDIYAALLTGAALYPLNMRSSENTRELSELLIKEKITIWHSVPSLYGFFAKTLKGEETFPHLRYIILGGEPVREHEIDLLKRYFPHSILANVYGQTESSLNSTWLVHPGDTVSHVIIGEPVGSTKLFLIDEEGREVDPFEIGEIVVASPHVSPGYWRHEQATRKSFTHHPEFGALYWTGDLGRLLLDGDIEFIGRKDFQFKIRGYRIEPGEIEARLLKHENITGAVVISTADENTDPFLAAYFISNKTLNPSLLREYLLQELPDYMIPSYFVRVDSMPLTRNGKIDRSALPPPQPGTGSRYVPPDSRIEEKLAEIWGIVLGLGKKRIGITDNFFDLGGHSLRAARLTLMIHQEFNIKVPLGQLFKTPFIKELAGHIAEAAPDRFIPIPCTEKKEYYPLWAAQNSIYIQQNKDKNNLGYNKSQLLELIGQFDKKKVETVFKQLIRRHEIFRTSFEIFQDEPVQKIHEQVDFKITYDEASPEKAGMRSKRFIKPFDLHRAPLLRLGVIKMAENRHLWIFDMHHIIYDGASMGILLKEFTRLYEEENLSPLRIQYKDFVRWQGSERQGKALARQRAYWQKVFAAGPRELNLPTDFARPLVQSFAGDSSIMEINRDQRRGLRNIENAGDATLFMILLALSYILLFKLSGQEDIIIGTPAAARSHAELQQVIGMFANTLAIRNYPGNEKSFKTFLTEVRESCLQAFENQDYPFENVMAQIPGKRDISRNPLFDVMFVLQNNEFPVTRTGDLQVKPFKLEKNISHYDLMFSAVEGNNNIRVIIEYSTVLFKRETIERISKYYMEILNQVIENQDILFKDIEITYDYAAARATIYQENQSEWIL